MTKCSSTAKSAIGEKHYFIRPANTIAWASSPVAARRSEIDDPNKYSRSSRPALVAVDQRNRNFATKPGFGDNAVDMPLIPSANNAPSGTHRCAFIEVFP